jgi:O-acetyl-ADP-ribose deacetylase (regulator of RNase III)/predicted RNA-binding Zn-ribbon protein involved in translation (DUF1610 family)
MTTARYPAAADRPTPPLQICSHGCGFFEPAQRRYRASTRRLWSARAEVFVDIEYVATCCPQCGAALVRSCPECNFPLLHAEDLRCRGCGVAHAWQLKGSEPGNRTSAGLWRQTARLIGEMQETNVWVTDADIVKLGVDAVVVSDDPSGYMVGSAARAVRRAWGERIEDDSVEMAPHELGTAWTTDAGPRASARFVIHTAAMQEGRTTSRAMVEKATLAAFVEAETKGVGSLAFSALGTGVAHFPLDSAGETMARVLHDYTSRQKSPSPVKDLIFVLFGQADLDLFLDGVHSVLPRLDSPSAGGSVET